MPPAQLKETTMDPENRTLLRVVVPDDFPEFTKVGHLVDRLMGRKPEHRFEFIQDNAADAKDLDI